MNVYEIVYKKFVKDWKRPDEVPLYSSDQMFIGTPDIPGIIEIKSRECNKTMISFLISIWYKLTRRIDGGRLDGKF